MYEIHDNGGRPFRIEIDDIQVMVFIVVDDKQYKHYSPLKTFNGVTKVFVGKDTNPEPDRHDGNSILIQLQSGTKGIFIGFEIYEFELFDEIVDYISPIGNNDVPYPYAIGTKGIYLMIEDVYITFNEYIMNEIKSGVKDPYRLYYDQNEKQITKQQKLGIIRPIVKQLIQKRL